MKRAKIKEYAIDFAEGIFQQVYGDKQPLDFFLSDSLGHHKHLRDELRNYLKRYPTGEETAIFIVTFQSEMRRLANRHNYPYTRQEKNPKSKIKRLKAVWHD